MIRHAFKLYGELARGFKKGVSRFFKYQLITNLLFSVLILPLFMAATNAVMRMSHYPAVSNTMLLDFIFSPSGMLYLLLGAGVVLLGVLLQLCGIIILSAQVLHDEPESSYWELLKMTLKTLPRLFEVGIVLIFAYLLVIAPLTGSGLKLDFFESLEIPDFIMTVIDGSTALSLSIVLVMLALTVVGFFMVFTFHFIILGKLKPSQAVKSSMLLVERHKGHFIKDVVLVLMLISVVFVAGEFLWGVATTSLIDQLDAANSMNRVLVVFLMLLQQVGVLLIGMLFIPFELHHFTVMYFEFVEKDDLFYAYREFISVIPAKRKPSWLDRLLCNRPLFIGLAIGGMLLIAIPSGVFFNEIFRADYPVAVIAHRAGGVNEQENSLVAARQSIQVGADWLEIDVQRTLDGVYVLYHDAAMKRIDNDSQLITEVGYDYIRSNQIQADTLEAMLQTCKGKIKLNIELKGEGTDKQMVDDVVAMVKRYGMSKDILLTTQNYDLIVYTKQKYPNIMAGLIYFLSIGNISELQADYLIVEMREATETLIDAAHEANKKVIVWTVNETDDMWDYTRMSVDGIITDEIQELKRVIDERDRESDQDLMYNIFFY